MAKKKSEEMIVLRTEEIPLNFYAVRSQDGKWMKRKKTFNIYSGGGTSDSSWTESIVEAKIYTKPGPAKAQITWWSTNYPSYGVPELVRITVGKCEYIDQTARVSKVVQKKKISDVKREMERIESALEYREKNYSEKKKELSETSDKEIKKLRERLLSATEKYQKLKDKN